MEVTSEETLPSLPRVAANCEKKEKNDNDGRKRRRCSQDKGAAFRRSLAKWRHSGKKCEIHLSLVSGRLFYIYAHITFELRGEEFRLCTIVVASPRHTSTASVSVYLHICVDTADPRPYNRASSLFYAKISRHSKRITFSPASIYAATLIFMNRRCQSFTSSEVNLG